MEVPVKKNVDQSLNDIQQLIMYESDYGNFITHRDRYKSDSQIIERFYQRGEILEIGAMPCHFTALLKVLGYPVIGVDLQPQRCQSVIDRFDLRVEQCDIERQPLPFADQTFDYILCNEVIEHLRVDPLFALAEINRVLTKDGILMLTTPNLYAIQQIARFMTGRGFGDPLTEFSKLRAIGHMGHIREYSHREIKRFLAFSNFQVNQLYYKHYYYPRTKRGMLARVLFRILPARFRSYQVVLAHKVGSPPAISPLA